jgi:hypothetical protein
MAWSKVIDFYVLSWGVPRTPACNLIETAQRKSQFFIFVRGWQLSHVASNLRGAACR